MKRSQCDQIGQHPTPGLKPQMFSTDPQRQITHQAMTNMITKKNLTQALLLFFIAGATLGANALGAERVACATDEHGCGKSGCLPEGFADQLGQGLILL